MTEPDLRWEDPPTPSSGGPGRRRFEAEATALKQHPGKWLLLVSIQKPKDAYALATRINHRTAYPALHGAEATSRVIDGEARVYVRWPAEDPS